MIVEDDAGVARLEQNELERRGYAVRVFGCAESALAQADLHAADCWLIDHGLPNNRTGLELVATLRENGVEAPVILVTGTDDPQVVLLALRAGVRDFVHKGNGFLELLVSRVDSVIAAARAERDLQRSRARAETEAMRRQELESEIAERRRAEARARDALARLQTEHQRKDEFLAMLGHELRNPLAPIASAVEVLREQGGSERAAWAAGVIGRQLDQMRRIVNDLLDVARIMNGQFTLRREPMNLAEALAQAVERIEPASQARGHELSYSPPRERLVVDGDAVRLVQAIGNLLDNAVKYTPPGGRVTLAVARQAGRVEVLVTDTGVGMEPATIDDLFGLFVQGRRDSDRAEGGLGLGLALVRRIVELHGGTVGAESGGNGGGSTFRVVLPLSTSDVAVATVRPQRPIARADRHVLVVDDNVDAAESLAILLRMWGFRVTTTHDGSSAIDAIDNQDPDAILLDLGLPGADGFEVIEAARRKPGSRARLWIAVSGYGRDADRTRTAEAGFDTHLVKPVEPESMARALAPLLE